MTDRQTSHEAEWDLDSDEIASVLSEDLHQQRPNRWTGSRSTWRTLTKEERMLWRSMRRVYNEDLSVHLYNAFALKKQARDPKTAQALTIKTETGQDAIWTPPKAWTAWPLREKHVPTPGLFRSDQDGNEPFTLRKSVLQMPSSELRDELTATILRLAKEKCRRRSARLHPQPHPSIEQQDDDDDDEEGGGAHSSTRQDTSSLPSSPPPDVDTDAASPRPSSPPPPTEAQGLESRIATDDDASHLLLRPCVSHLLSQLDRTLTILHNTRVAGLSSLSDSESSNTEDEPDRRRRPRPPSPPPPPRSTTRRGRPRKTHIPRDGETPQEMQARVAREMHRRIPVDADAAFEAWLREDDGPSVHQRPPRAGKLRAWGLRDWSDVLGAAALADFPEQVVARATQRCANLFGQGMTMRRLVECSAHRPPAVCTTAATYRPDKIRLSPSSSDEETGGRSILVQRRIASRAASSSSRGRASSPGTSTSRRSRSRSSGLLFCPVPTCDRAANGFSRRANLKRHVSLVHPDYHSDERHDHDDDSASETLGAVHVDGFLKTINPARGWRGEDALRRKRKRSRAHHSPD